MNITDARGEKCRQSSLLFSDKFYLPPLHVKLDLMKNLVKCMDKTGRGVE